MYSYVEIFKKENEETLGSYLADLKRIRTILDDTSSNESPYFKLINYICRYSVHFAEMESKYSDDFFMTTPLEKLKNDNHLFFSELLTDNYKKSYANPTYCVEIFGDDMGQLISYFYVQYRSYLNYALQHKTYMMAKYNSLLIRVYEYMVSNTPDYNVLKEIITYVEFENITSDTVLRLKERMDGRYSYYTEIVKYCDLSDLRYLYKYDRYITDNEENLAKFMLQFSHDKVETLARTVVEAYIRSFERDGKSLCNRRNVYIIYAIGNEILVKRIIDILNEYGLRGRASLGLISTDPNMQFDYDHRFDNALYINENNIETMKRAHLKAIDTCRDIMLDQSGVIAFRSFGEQPFAPLIKKECLKMSKNQAALYQSYNSFVNSKIQEFVKKSETSFTIMALPNPELGEKYEEVFDAIYEINTMDSHEIEKIQQILINCLDKAEYVHVKGKDTNLTDIKIYLPELKDPDKETVFFNCTADSNIPAGEVYTSPKLTNTTGLLHNEEVFLRGFNYVDLKLHFKNGFIESYTCRNFNEIDENHKYIEENILFPHKTLPIGEFAIGTNTLAYAIAKKFDIMHLLPILIVEKMGPHFAVGDTCFKNEEDLKIYNLLDGKEVIGKENEKTSLRKINPDEAYTYKHLDITLPYEKLEFITAVSKDGCRVDLIKNGRFVLKGTEALNKPLDTL